MKISRSAQKRQYEQLTKLAEALVDLPAGAQAHLPCDEELRAEIRAVADMQGGARRRQTRYVAKLLEAAGDTDALYRFVAERKGRALVAARIQHRAEHWRKALLDEALDFAREYGEDDMDELWSGETLQALEAELPRLDLRAVARLARRFAVSRDPRHSREIFRILKAGFEEQERDRGEEKTDSPVFG